MLNVFKYDVGENTQLKLLDLNDVEELLVITKLIESISG